MRGLICLMLCIVGVTAQADEYSSQLIVIKQRMAQLEAQGQQLVKQCEQEQRTNSVATGFGAYTGKSPIKLIDSPSCTRVNEVNQKVRKLAQLYKLTSNQQIEARR